MPEAVAEVMKFGFLRLNLHRITARYMEGNIPSRRVMEKVGMSFEGTFRRAVYIKGDYRTVSACAILREEFLAMREKQEAEKRHPFLKS
jgi:ribosomal-protein-alanine N-acetyltransferase